MAEIFSNVKEALDIYQTQYSQVDILWHYFGTVTLAVLGFTIGSEKATKSMSEVTTIVLGYVVFCVGNFGALSLGQKQLIDFAKIAVEAAQRKGFSLNNLEPLSTSLVSWFYWGVVISVCSGIVFIALQRQRGRLYQKV